MTRSKTEHRKMKSASRLYAVQALFQMEASGQTVDSVMREFETFRFGATYEEGEMQEGDPATFRGLVEGAVNHQGVRGELNPPPRPSQGRMLACYTTNTIATEQ